MHWQDLRSVYWIGPLRGYSGYAVEGRAMVSILRSMLPDVIEVHIDGPRSFDQIESLSESQHSFLTRLLKHNDPSPNDVFIYHRYWHAPRLDRMGKHVWRTMFETNSIPPAWLQSSVQYDQLWVPSEFNLHTFSNGGVDPDRLRTLPCPLPEESSNLLSIAQEREATKKTERRRLRYLSIMKWERRKGWDTLLRAFGEEFDSDEAELVIKTTRFVTRGGARDPWNEWLTRCRGRVRFISRTLNTKALNALYRDSDVFVLASRGEGWGRPYMEAMLSGLPTIGTGWSGNREFMNRRNSYLLQYDLVPTSESAAEEWEYFRDQIWADPDLLDLRRQLRGLYEYRSSSINRLQLARELAVRYSAESIERRLWTLLREL
jgi:glycosyltransferase involved in cell wall biosynthesis